MDTITHEQRSHLMSRVHSKDTKPEMIVRSFLHRQGFRFRLHAKDLPGHPDIVLPKYKTIVEVRGCFWHRHPGCRKTTTPTSNAAFWDEKFRRNMARDKKNDSALKALGWQVVVVWDCQVQDRETLMRLPDLILHRDQTGESSRLSEHK